MTRTLMASICAPLLACCLVACGPKESLLVTGSVDDIYSAEAAGGYGVTSTDPADVGTVTGRVTFEGRAYKRRQIQLSTDKFCVTANPSGLLSENFVFDPATKGLENVFVYVKSGLAKMKFPVPSEPIVLDQIGCRYVPHMARLRVGQPLVIKSSDNTLHNVHGLSNSNPEFNKTMSTPSQLPAMYYEKPEYKEPARISCDVHGWMKSFMTVLPHPFSVITAKDGSFELKGLPPGNYKLVIWHEYLGSQELDITLENKQALALEPVVFTRG